MEKNIDCNGKEGKEEISSTKVESTWRWNESLEMICHVSTIVNVHNSIYRFKQLRRCYWRRLFFFAFLEVNITYDFALMHFKEKLYADSKEDTFNRNEICKLRE